MSRFTENPDEIVLKDIEMFHLESMNERSLWIGVYGKDGKIYTQMQKEGKNFMTKIHFCVNFMWLFHVWSQCGIVL